MARLTALLLTLGLLGGCTTVGHDEHAISIAEDDLIICHFPVADGPEP